MENESVRDDGVVVPDSSMADKVKAKAKEIGRMPNTKSDGDISVHDEDVIRVGANTNVERLAFHIVNRIKDSSVAICQAIGPAANQRVDLAMISAQSTIVKYAPKVSIVALPCIRKPKMENGEERTALRKIIFGVNTANVP